MKLPQIEWRFDNLPSNRDEMEPLGTFVMDNESMLIAINHTTGELIFIWDGNYGKLISGDKNG